MKLIRENLLLLTICLGIVLAWFLPEPGTILKHWGMSNPLIIAIFFCQGLGLEGRELRRKAQLAKAISWGFVISQIIGPLLAYAAVHVLNWRSDNQIGFMVICCMAPTLVSGAVLAGRAGGESATALILAVALNLLGILTIPLNLQWSLGAVVRLDTAGLLFKLVLLVLVPAVIGQAIKRLQPNWAHQQERFIRTAPIVALGIIVYLSCSSQADRLKELTLSYLGSLLLPSVVVHLLLLAAGYTGARYLFRLQEPACRSLAIVCSQKTLPIAIAVWSIAFAEAYPLAVLPALVFHPSQIFCDGVLATFWGKR
ncbi:MAG: bile acid:sodium symporter [Syntrophobacterales bacterium]